MAVREGLLALLADGPRHGFQLKNDFEIATGGVWPLNVGQVYQTLDRLERDALVTVSANDPDADGRTQPGQKSYELTAAGREALGAWWVTMPADEPPPRDELMLKVLFAIDTSMAHALAVITQHRSALLTMLQHQRRSAQADGLANALASALVRDALVVRAEADLRWLDLCESRILKAERTNHSDRNTSDER